MTVLALEFLYKPGVNKARKMSGLAPIRSYNEHVISSPSILCLDERLAPRAPQWPDNIEYTGYPFLVSKEELPTDLVRFLNQGEAPVYIGFGSMGSDDPVRTTETILNAIKTHTFYSTS